MNKLATAAVLVNRGTMKGLLVTAGILLAITLPAHAESWRYIMSSPDGEFFLDDDSVRRNGDTVYFSSLMLLPVPRNEVSGMKIFRSLSCGRRVWRTRSMVMYNKRNEVVGQLNDGDKGRLLPITSGSVGEILYLQVCR